MRTNGLIRLRKRSSGRGRRGERGRRRGRGGVRDYRIRRRSSPFPTWRGKGSFGRSLRKFCRNISFSCSWGGERFGRNWGKHGTRGGRGGVGGGKRRGLRRGRGRGRSGLESVGGVTLSSLLLSTFLNGSYWFSLREKSPPSSPRIPPHLHHLSFTPFLRRKKLWSRRELRKMSIHILKLKTHIHI